MDQIFNEFSVDAGYVSSYEANSGMSTLVELSKSLTDIGFNQIIRTTKDIAQLNIAPNYTILSWATERKGNIDRDSQRYFLTAATQAPYIEDLLILKEEEDHKMVEFKIDQSLVYGLGLAYLWDSSVLSLEGNSKLETDRVLVDYYQMDEEAENREKIEVISLATEIHLKDNKTLLRTKLFSIITNGASLFESAPIFFPTLSISKTAKRQLERLTGDEEFFHDVVHHFDVLNETMCQWKSGALEPGGISWSVESMTTLQQFGTEREFICTDKVKRQFSLHTKLMSSNKRIYYYPIPDKQVIHIGYVGDHLPTTKYRT